MLTQMLIYHWASTPSCCCVFKNYNRGLLSRHGIKKASYHAYELLHSAGEWRLPMTSSQTSSYSVGGYALTNDHPQQSTITLFIFNYDDPQQTWKSQVMYLPHLYL
jgi:hypothetical protein